MKSYTVYRAVLPVCIHFLIANIVVILLGNVMDAASRTSLSAVLLIPVFYYWYKGDGKWRIDAQKTRICWYVLPAMMVFGAICGQILNGLMNFLRLGTFFSNDTQESLYQGSIWIQVTGLGILVPVMEEFLFRGLVYGRLKTAFSVRQSMIAGAAIFALYHGNPLQIIFAFPLGLLIILIYEKTGAIKAPIAFHMGVNLSSVLLTMLMG